MKTLIALISLAAVTACASAPRDPALDAYPGAQSLREERARDSVARMQQEFDALTGGAN